MFQKERTEKQRDHELLQFQSLKHPAEVSDEQIGNLSL